MTRSSVRPAVVFALLALPLTLGPRPAEAQTELEAVQRYPRTRNPDGTAQCFPDGCDLFGPCCS